MDLYSINYLHLGKAKYWYSVALEDSEKFEEFMRKSFPEAFRECKEFIRHKNFLVHPQLLINQGIKLHK
jgi:DNA damage-responsive transcriptional repressor / [histone H3]-trimethyl-L-lysine36 demethylase